MVTFMGGESSKTEASLGVGAAPFYMGYCDGGIKKEESGECVVWRLPLLNRDRKTGRLEIAEVQKKERKTPVRWKGKNRGVCRNKTNTEGRLRAVRKRIVVEGKKDIIEAWRYSPKGLRQFHIQAPVRQKDLLLPRNERVLQGRIRQDA